MLTTNQELGHYRVLRLLGTGGMAEVYEAEDQMLGRKVALKVLESGTVGDQEMVARFEKEVRLVASMNHRGIVSVYDVGSGNGLHYYSMRLLTGGDLRQRIAAGLNETESLRILREVTEAFAHAHKRGLVHRDVKPGNILFDEDGNAVVTDFGIAKGIMAPPDLTRVGTVIGTPRYMSPEQASGRLIDARSDIYSLGVILFEMLTGRLPYEADNFWAVIYKHARDPIPRLPPALARVQPLIDRLMAKVPDERPANGQEVIQAIDELLKATPAPPPPAAGDQLFGTALSEVPGWTTVGNLPRGGDEKTIVRPKVDALAETRHAPVIPPAPKVAQETQATTTAAKPRRLLIGVALIGLPLLLGMIWLVVGFRGSPAATGNGSTPSEPSHATAAPVVVPPPAPAAKPDLAAAAKERPAAAPAASPAPSAPDTRQAKAAPAVAPAAAPQAEPPQPATTTAKAEGSGSSKTVAAAPQTASEPPPQPVIASRALPRPASPPTRHKAPRSAAAVDDSRCADLLTRVSLGESMDDDDKSYFASNCK